MCIWQERWVNAKIHMNKNSKYESCYIQLAKEATQSEGKGYSVWIAHCICPDSFC